VEVWDDVVDAFLAGGRSLPDRLRLWAEGYRGTGDGVVQWDAFPEPFVGALDRRPLMIFLALNPGRASPEMQSSSGVLAEEIRRMGSYRAWAASWPFLREVWTSRKGRNKHHVSRLEFMRRWWHRPELTCEDMVGFELYPWHSIRVTAQMRPDPGVIREFVLAPIEELGNAPVFAFGAPWFAMFEKHLGLSVVARLGVGGLPYPTRVRDRAAVVFALPNGASVIAVRQGGYAGPPSALETVLLQEALASVGVKVPSPIAHASR
jgi:hypothetical protein